MEAFCLRWLLLVWQCFVIPVWGLEFYKAAVYEHSTVLRQNLIPPTREEALELMQKNLDIYQEQVHEASKQGVKIIVFPENGIHGFPPTRATIYPYLEPIPDPDVVQWNPCLHPTEYSDTEVLYQLSCMARNSSMYLIANLGEREACEFSDPKCPSDGRYHFNTNVVFDAEGTLIAKYQKWKLFRTEIYYNKPKTLQHVIFDTPFAGKFGIFTCFDILFYEPAVSLIERYGIKQIIFPTAWMNKLPLLSAVQFHQAFAAAFGINLLVSNQHHPEYNMTGSGIYTPLDFPYYYNMKSREGKLLVADVPIITSINNHTLEQSDSQTSTFLQEQKGAVKQEQTDLFNLRDRMKNIQLLIICASIFLLVCVTAEPVITEGGWKSLDEQQNRDLFFRILQSYFTGRGMNLGLSRKEKLQGTYGSKIGSYADKSNNNLYNKDTFTV
ncbi:hypothetical protein scyTo_0011755 [Scyliorhinus torazame]|uniref:Biotinidase n=1 Tax=Scyliorhinus torazame TaxID=75743 RepID=A0A401NUB5_SCYTO|nr:hypothetical protein [Scyliorhinus torazame]